jgi:Sodium:dicarboxylate symporter family
MTMAALFLAQATNTHLALGQQLAILVVAMLSSKGATGVTGAGFITLAATLSVVPSVPIESLAILVGIERFMSECRALVNLVGNGLATVVVSLWERELTKEDLNANLLKSESLADITAEERGDQHAPNRYGQNSERQLKRGWEAIDQGGHRNPKTPVGHQNGQDGDNIELLEIGQIFDRAPEGEAFGLPKEGERLARVAQKGCVDELVDEGFLCQGSQRPPRAKPAGLQLVKPAVHQPEQAEHQEIKSHVDEVFPGPTATLVKVNGEHLR